METGEVIYEKVYASPRPPPKISLKHDWKRELVSEDAQRPEGQVVHQFRNSQSNQPIPNPDHDRSGQPVVGTDRSEQPVVGTDTRRSKHVLFMKKLSTTIDRGDPLLKQEQPKHVYLLTARVSTLKIRRHMTDRCDPLLKHTQIMCQTESKHVLVMKA